MNGQSMGAHIEARTGLKNIPGKAVETIDLEFVPALIDSVAL